MDYNKIILSLLESCNMTTKAVMVNTNIIVAASENDVIGNNDSLAFKSKLDMSFFKNKTLYHVVLMGRKTFESLPKQLANRITVVISRSMKLKEYVKEHTVLDVMGDDNVCIYKHKYSDRRIVVANSYSDGKNIAKVLSAKISKDAFYVAGGSQIYLQAMEIGVYKIFLNRFLKHKEGNKTFTVRKDMFEIIKYDGMYCDDEKCNIIALEFINKVELRINA